MKSFLCFFVFVSLNTLVMAENNGCDQWPEGLVFVGLKEGEWQTYGVTKTGQAPENLAINTEVRTPVMSLPKGVLFYIDSSSQLSEFSLKENKTKILFSSSAEASYAQPEFNENNNSLYIVQLKQGNSVDTDILHLDLATHTIKPLIIQRSAQFEPDLSVPWLYYSNVHCVLGCGKIIQEIWRYHTVSGIAEQLTLQNAISRQPTADKNNHWLYFSSNVAGNYHLYRQSLTQKKSPAEQLTQGAVTDMSPAVIDERLYFIRQHEQGSILMCRDRNGELHKLPLPKGLTQLRDLEI
jgi:hypothetical protein